MSVRNSESALRRLVAELASLSEEDIEAIVDELDPRSRERIRLLLDEYSGSTPDSGRVADTAGDFDPAALSLWLVERISGGGENREMTAHAAQTLRSKARQLFPAGDSRSPARGSSLFGRLAGARKHRATP